MVELELTLWLAAILLLALLFSSCLWRMLAYWLPMLKIPYWSISAGQTLMTAFTCWGLGLGPALGWFGLLLFLSLLQLLLTALMLPLWLFARRVASCDPLRERI